MSGQTCSAHASPRGNEHHGGVRPHGSHDRHFQPLWEIHHEYKCCAWMNIRSQRAAEAAPQQPLARSQSPHSRTLMRVPAKSVMVQGRPAVTANVSRTFRALDEPFPLNQHLYHSSVCWHLLFHSAVYSTSIYWNVFSFSFISPDCKYWYKNIKNIWELPVCLQWSLVTYKVTLAKCDGKWKYYSRGKWCI